MKTIERCLIVLLFYYDIVTMKCNNYYAIMIVKVIIRCNNCKNNYTVLDINSNCSHLKNSVASGKYVLVNLPKLNSMVVRVNVTS